MCTNYITLVVSLYRTIFCKWELIPLVFLAMFHGFNFIVPFMFIFFISKIIILINGSSV